MKKIIITIAACLSSAFLFAQIPNNDFEDWTTASSYDSLNNWNTDNFFVAGTAAKETSLFYSGATSLRLTTMLYASIAAIPGAASTGGFAVTFPNIDLSQGGQPDTQRHAFLKGHYAYTPVGTAHGSIEVVLLRRNGSSRDTIAYGSLDIATATTGFQPFSIPLNYLSVNTPDSSIVYFQSSGRTSTDIGIAANAGSVLLVDSVYFDQFNGINDLPSNLISINTFPNPASDFFYIETKWKTPEHVCVSFIDPSGKIIFTKKISPGCEKIDLKNFCAGNYFYRLENETGKIIFTGKFAVAK